ncbi:acyl-CoA dehydrogenase family protein [Actinomadura livida]|uniref:Acyl-CoA dehydrogenase family protein n=1 Tax=Actinomadura livida TaxID=79909 RepID=A0A7W7IAM2_9ACTN|nr:MULTISPECIES: acyl-CoA dehydrogenase family protein [Actinomadura]MBB4773607.1 alkylation response protein AidB-like acyl-CoA dehydrogenase [Actinomadura catellatispora]GGU09475.1 acyl-CoA dehydrogenase [Actinomadura livida]
MSVVLTDLQEELRRTVRGAIEARHGAARVIELAEAGAEGDDADVWKALSDIGVPQIGTPDSGTGLLDLGLMVQEAGRGLLPGTLLGHALGQRLLLAADGAAGPLAEADAAGHRLAASWRLDPAAVTVEPDGVLHGRAGAIAEGRQADVLVLPVTGPAVACVDTNSLGFSPEKAGAIDTGRDWTAVDLDGIPARVYGLEPESWRRVLLEAAVLLCFDSLGSAERCLDDAVRYAKERRQFGQAIGGFQAVKHLLVDAHVAVDNARSATWHAAAALDSGAADAAFSAHVAKAVTDQAHVRTAAAGIQVHGGTGFTREVAAHLHARRSRYNERLAGTPAEHLDAMADDLPMVLGQWSGVPADRT